MRWAPAVPAAPGRCAACRAASPSCHAPTLPCFPPGAPAAVAGGLRGNLVQAGRAVVASHGLGALYKGFRASLLGDVLGNALGFTAYEIGNR